MNGRTLSFSTRDWKNDASLRLCTLAAQGLWIDMLCEMVDGKPYGYLTTSTGKPLSVEALAKIIGQSPESVIPCIAELEEAQVFSRTSDGIIYCRRLVRAASKKKIMLAPNAEIPHFDELEQDIENFIAVCAAENLSKKISATRAASLRRELAVALEKIGDRGAFVYGLREATKRGAGSVNYVIRATRSYVPLFPTNGHANGRRPNYSKSAAEVLGKAAEDGRT